MCWRQGGDVMSLPVWMPGHHYVLIKWREPQLTLKAKAHPCPRGESVPASVESVHGDLPEVVHKIGQKVLMFYNSTIKSFLALNHRFALMHLLQYMKLFTADLIKRDLKNNKNGALSLIWWRLLQSDVYLTFTDSVYGRKKGLWEKVRTGNVDIFQGEKVFCWRSNCAITETCCAYVSQNEM